MTRPIVLRAPNPESALLLACARPCSSTEPASRVSLRASCVESWPSVLTLARHHRMRPLLYTHLRALPRGTVRNAVLEELRAAFAGNAERSFSQAKELIAIMDLLHSRALDALPYEGPVVGQCIFGNAALRETEDSKLLLHARDVPQAVRLLKSRGFCPITRLYQPSVTFGLEYQCSLLRPTDGSVVELHWTVDARVLEDGMGFDELWKVRRDTALLNQALPTPSHEDLLVILCMHGARHRWARLGWISGVAALIRANPLAWCRVLDRAVQWGGGHMLRSALLLAHELLEAPVPEAVLAAALSDPEALAPEEFVLDGLLSAVDRSLPSYANAFVG